MSQIPIAEEFRPIPIRREAGLIGGLAFAGRMLVDLQLLTCTRFLAPHLAMMEGRVLDVGCGEMPFRSFLQESGCYIGLDVSMAGDFGMRRQFEIVDFDGFAIPFPDASFDHIPGTEERTFGGYTAHRLVPR